MTALALGLALAPLVMGEPDSKTQAPMTIVILLGLLSSALLNVLVTPALYLRFGSSHRKVEASQGGLF